MKIITTIIIIFQLTSLGESKLQDSSKENVKLSKIELIIMKRSILLLGGNSRPNSPTFTSMNYDKDSNELHQFFTVEASTVEKVLAGDKKAIEEFKFKYKMERSSIEAGYLLLSPKDIFKMHFSTIGGEKGFIVTKEGIAKRK